MTNFIIFYVFFPILTMTVIAVDDWQLVFKAATGGVENVYDLYTDSSTLNVDNAAAQSLTSAIAEHFKSDVINNWSTAGICQVRLSVYRDGAEVAFFIFNGFGSDKMSWMSKGRLLNSSYTDMNNAQSTTQNNVFSIVGIRDRAFSISYDEPGCPPDTGWIMVIDTDAGTMCDYETMTTRPYIVYSPLPTQANCDPAHNLYVGDSLAIHVKYEPCMPNEESTTQLENSPTLTNTATSQLQSEPTMSTFDQNGMPNQESTTQMENSPTLTNTATVSTSHLQSELTMVSTIDQNGTYCCTPCILATTETVEITTPKTTTHDKVIKTGMVDLEKKIKVLKAELTVDKKNTTRYKRSRMSVYETRTTAVAIGMVGATVIALVILFFVLVDGVNFVNPVISKKEKIETALTCLN